MASSTPQLLSLLSPASSPRPTFLSLPNLSTNDKEDQHLQPGPSRLYLDNHLQNSILRQSLEELSDHGVVNVSYKKQVNTGSTRYVVEPDADTIRLFCSIDTLIQNTI